MVAKGSIVWISGPAVKANGMSEAKMYETVSVGNAKLIGEDYTTNWRCGIYPSV